ncbi:unnamed protein product [Cuscuta epithymum]|uniref:Uncharacterized protein n=1 Tax=Cuscuta epithymum TaxID=186058 RepID=A0AAV0DM82_9ASTE|nr:unnamed protein product [Cuscuta epithymum]
MAPCRQFKYIDASRLPGLKTGGCELQEHDCNKESTGNDEMIASALDSRGNKEFIGGSYVLRKKAHGEANERKKGKKKTNEWFDVPGDAELRKKKESLGKTLMDFITSAFLFPAATSSYTQMNFMLNSNEYNS